MHLLYFGYILWLELDQRLLDKLVKFIQFFSLLCNVFFARKLCSCGFIVELCCLAVIKYKTIHRWPYLAGPRSLLVPLLCPNVFLWLNIPLFISVIVFLIWIQ